MKNIKKGILFLGLMAITTLGYSQNSESNEKLLQHVLLFQWTEGHDEDSKTKVLDLFKGMPGKIDGLESFEIRDVTASSGKFDSILILQFTSEEVLNKTYEEHPDHSKIKEIAPSLISGFASYDYWE